MTARIVPGISRVTATLKTPTNSRHSYRHFTTLMSNSRLGSKVSNVERMKNIGRRHFFKEIGVGGMAMAASYVAKKSRQGSYYDEGFERLCLAGNAIGVGLILYGLRDGDSRLEKMENSK